MSQNMKAVGVVPSRKEVRQLEHPRPKLTRDNELLIRTLEVGICGTDREICTFAYGTPPEGCDYLILGHECLGEVLEVGSGVKHLKKGDLVVPSVRRPCPDAECRPCREGRQDFCFTGHYVERGIKERHGYMTEFFVEEETFLTPVPPSIRDVAVMTEPLTVAEKGLTQAWKVQERLPWEHPEAATRGRGYGRTAVVLGAGPIGMLGAMKLLIEGFKVIVYSRSPKPNPKAELVEAIGAHYISSKEVNAAQLAEMAGRIDLIYEAVGEGQVSFDVLGALGVNGVCVFTGIPAPHGPIPVHANQLIRDITLKNLAIVGTVNASPQAFIDAIRDLGEFKRRWPNELKALITDRGGIERHRDFLVGKATGIKNVLQFA